MNANIKSKKLTINGTIKRICEKCKKDTECCSFLRDGESHLMCPRCVMKEYNHKVPKKFKKLRVIKEFCSDCKSLTMKRVREYRSIKKEIMLIFKCEECGKILKTKQQKKR